MDETLQWAIATIMDEMKDKNFYGSFVISVQGGKVQGVRKEESFKPPVPLLTKTP